MRKSPAAIMSLSAYRRAPLLCARASWSSAWAPAPSIEHVSDLFVFVDVFLEEYFDFLDILEPHSLENLTTKLPRTTLGTGLARTGTNRGA